MDGNHIDVTCPTCFETFSVPQIPPTEAPCSVDYDCEVCCRPMVIHFEVESDHVTGFAAGVDE